MIPCYIPSKDRVAQCDLLLRSLEKNAPGIFDPTVVYTYSNSDFAAGYENLVDFNNANFQYEYNGETQFYDFLEEHASENELVCLFADDCIFYRQTVLKEDDIRAIFKNEDLWTFTYRLGRNISIRDYVYNIPTAPPSNYAYNNFWYMWNLREGEFWDIHYFPTGFDGYIYRAKDLLDLSCRASFKRICFWEKLICEKFQSKPPERNLMAAPLESEVFIQQINTSHEFGHRTSRKFNMSTEQINKQWLSGKEIILNSIDFSNINCTHGEIPFSMEVVQ